MVDAPVAAARDATLPPLIGTGNALSVNLVATDASVEIGSSVTYQAWTFGDTVPAPVIHVRQGQTVQVTLTNHGTMPHSIDFHAAQIAPNPAFHDVNPGETEQFSFVATTPGVFLYHCGSTPVLLHISNGMCGALVVDPTPQLPPATESFVLVQGEWYTSQAEGTVMTGHWSKMLATTPDEVVFNGTAFQHRDHALVAHPGQRVRLYVVNAGPNLASVPIFQGLAPAIFVSAQRRAIVIRLVSKRETPGEGDESGENEKRPHRDRCRDERRRNDRTLPNDGAGLPPSAHGLRGMRDREIRIDCRRLCHLSSTPGAVPLRATNGRGSSAGRYLFERASEGGPEGIDARVNQRKLLSARRVA